MQSFVLQREAQTRLSTWGVLRDPFGNVLCRILERGAANPVHRRIPAGTYTLSRKPFGASHFDGAFRNRIGGLYAGIPWLPDVPGRSDIEIHTANFVTQLEGCLATGDAIARDGAGDFMIAAGTSHPAFARFYAAFAPAIAAGEARLIIHDPPT